MTHPRLCKFDDSHMRPSRVHDIETQVSRPIMKNIAQDLVAAQGARCKDGQIAVRIFTKRPFSYSSLSVEEMVRFITHDSSDSIFHKTDVRDRSSYVEKRVN